MDKKIYYGYYKCRLCGQIFTNFSCPTHDEAIEEIKSRPDRLNTYHYHDCGCLGYSDFIGFMNENRR